MNLKKIIALIIIALTLAGCITEFNALLPPDQSTVLFVEGDVIENTDAIFHLSRNFSMDSVHVPEESLDVSAELYLIDSNGNKSQPALSLGRGAYQLAVGPLDDNVGYGLQIEYDGHTYQSQLSKPLHTPEIDSVSWTQPERLGPVYFHVSTHSDAEGEDFFLWTYQEDWEISVKYPTGVFYDVNTDRLYEVFPEPNIYCWKKFSGNSYLLGSMEAHSQKKIVNRELYRKDAGDDRFEMLYSVNITQRAISRSAFEYYQNFKEMNEGMGGLFTPQPTEIVGNIACVTHPDRKVTGYVEVIRNITQKRLFVYRHEVTRPVITEDCREISEEELSMQIFSLTELYRIGYRPATYIGSLNFCWALRKCTDCTAKGGTKDKPDFWPNAHY